MRALKVICILGLIAVLSNTALAEEKKRVAKVVDLKGKAEARLSGKKTWVPVEIGAILTQGDVIKTKTDSWVLLNLNGSGETAAVELSENSQLMLSELIMEKKEQQTLLDLAIGKVLIRAQKLHSEKSRFEVKTPTSIVGVRGTTFAVEVEALD